MYAIRSYYGTSMPYVNAILTLTYLWLQRQLVLQFWENGQKVRFSYSCSAWDMRNNFV